MKKIKAKWVFLTLKPAFAVNLLFPHLTMAHSVSTSGSKSEGIFCLFSFASDTSQIPLKLKACTPVFSLYPFVSVT